MVKLLVSNANIGVIIAYHLHDIVQRVQYNYLDASVQHTQEHVKNRYLQKMYVIWKVCTVKHVLMHLIHGFQCINGFNTLVGDKSTCVLMHCVL